MTMVIEDQVKAITAELAGMYGDKHHPELFAIMDIKIEDVVRTVIAQYDISSIKRMKVPLNLAADENKWEGA